MFTDLQRPIKREIFDKSLKYIYNKVGRMAGNYITYRGMKAVASTPGKINNMPPVRTPRTPQYARKGPLSRQAMSFPQRKVKRPQFSATPRGTRVSVRNVGALSSKSAGRFKTKKYKITKTHRKAIGGVSETFEVGRQLVSNGQCMWIGHNSAPIEKLWLNFWRVIIKKLLDRTGFPVRNFGEVLAQITPGDVVNISYTVADGVVGSQSYTLTAADSADTIVVFLFNNVALRLEGIVFTQIAYLPTTNAVGTGTDRPGTKLDLEHAMIDVYCKSSMKIQNRTQNTSIDSEAVDNVPLYGKIYSGNGNGVNMLTSTATGTQIQLLANNANGLITGSEADLAMSEPPHAWFFPGVSKAGKAHLEPGAIKTNVLTYKRKISINYFRKMIGRQFTLGVTKAKLPFGKFCFFGFEKMIQTAAPAVGNITVGLEINHFIAMNMTLKHRSVSAMAFSTNFT